MDSIEISQKNNGKSQTMTNDMKDNLSKCDDQSDHLKTTTNENVEDG